MGLSILEAKERTQAGDSNNHRQNLSARNLYALFVVLILGATASLIPSAFHAEKWSTTEALMLFSNRNNATTLIGDYQQPWRQEMTTTTPEIPALTENQQQQVVEEEIVKSIVCKDHKPPSDPNIGKGISKKYVEKTNPKFWISLHTRFFDLLRWNSIMEKGEYYETGLTNKFYQILHDKPPGLVIDVGMNIGWFTIYSRAMGHKVIGFDPNPIMHSRVCESLELNNWTNDESVDLFPYGLGDRLATLNLTTGNNPGKSSFHEDRLARKFRKKIVVPVTSLDILAKQKGWLNQPSKKQPLIHLLKVDVEGYEPHVFRGATELINTGLIHNIIMENSVAELKDVSEMFLLLAKANYRIHLLLTVNGDPFHEELIEPTNEVLDSYTGEEKTDSSDPIMLDGLKYFAGNTINVWWQHKSYSNK